MLADINESSLWVHVLLAMFGPIVSFVRDSAPKLTQPAHSLMTGWAVSHLANG